MNIASPLPVVEDWAEKLTGSEGAMVMTAKYGCTSAMSRRYFLAGLGALAGSAVYGVPHARARSAPEKDVLKFGFIKLTDCAPLVIAYEKQFFDDEGLLVSLEAQANWKVLLDRVIDGQLDGAHMLAGQPLGATIGIGTQAHIITAFEVWT